MWAAIAALCLLFVSCGMLAPQTQATTLAVVEDMFKQGIISVEQYEALKQLIVTQPDSGLWWKDAARILAEVGLSFLTVQAYRGSPTQKVGLPASKIVPSAPQPA